MKRNIFDFWKKCPLLSLVLASGLVITGISLADPGGIYQNYEKETVMAPALAAFFRGIKENRYPWQEASPVMKMEDAMPPEDEGLLAAGLPDEETDEGDEMPEGQAETAQMSEDGAAERVFAVRQEARGQDVVKSREEEGRDPAGTKSESAEEQENADGFLAGETAEKSTRDRRLFLGNVEEEYFEDALFIGDSRTQGLFEYGGFSENVTFYCKTSLTVYDLFKKEKAFIKEDGKSVTLEQALAAHSFKKIYLMIGINEIGTGTAESFFEEYARAVYRIQSLQPDAVIFVQGIMHVGEKKNASDRLFNNTNIEIRNVEIATLADNQSIFYLDVNEVLCDENGNLFDGWSNDQIHLKAKYYAVWKEYLMAHGAVETEETPEELMLN